MCDTKYVTRFDPSKANGQSSPIEPVSMEITDNLKLYLDYVKQAQELLIKMQADISKELKKRKV
jgi:hypothetical protein